MLKLTSCVGSVLLRLGVLLAAGVMSGAPGLALAQDAGVLHACVEKDRRDGEVHGNIRIVLPNERCRRNEARFQLNVGETGDGDAEYGEIRGQAANCPATLGAAGSFVYVAGHPFVVITGEGGEFVLIVPSGSYELTLHVGNYSKIVPEFQVGAGETKDLGLISVCIQD